jgi:tetratricopeptide (TPR) repeat protein
MPARKKIPSSLLLRDAREAEYQGDADKALALYKDVVNSDPLVEEAWQRLMILYRKRKDYAGELKIINLALQTFESRNREEQRQWLQKNRKIANLARSLAKSLGLLDKKGIVIDDNPVLEKWRHRKEWVAARLKKSVKRR